MNEITSAVVVGSARADHPRRWVVLGVMSLATLIVQIDQSGMTIALPHLQRALGASIAQLQWVMDAYSVALAALVLTAGAFSDRVGRRRVFLAGIAVFAGASVVGSVAGTVDLVIAARALMGLGAAMFMPGTLSILTQVFSAEARAQAIGIWGAATSLGVVIGPLLGGGLLQFFTWRSIFVANVVVAGVALVAAAIVVPESRDDHPRRLDPVGTVLSSGGLVLLTFGIIASSERGLLDLRALGGVLAGVALLVTFWLRASANPRSMFDVSIARTRTFRAAALAAAGMMFVMAGLLFVFTQQLQLIESFSTLRTGVAILPMAGAAVLSSMLAPTLAQRTSSRFSIMLGLGLFAAAGLSLAGLQPITGYGSALAVLVLVGLGIGPVAAVANDVLMSSGPSSRSGLISSMNDTVQEVGTGLGVAVVGAVLSHVYVRSLAGTVPPPLASSLSATLSQPQLREQAYAAFAVASRAAGVAAAVAAVLALVGVAVLLRREPGAAPEPPPGDPTGA